MKIEENVEKKGKEKTVVSEIKIYYDTTMNKIAWNQK